LNETENTNDNKKEEKILKKILKNKTTANIISPSEESLLKVLSNDTIKDASKDNLSLRKSRKSIFIETSSINNDNNRNKDSNNGHNGHSHDNDTINNNNLKDNTNLTILNSTLSRKSRRSIIHIDKDKLNEDNNNEDEIDATNNINNFNIDD